ncbi:MAG: hypothetical protein NUV88_00685 [Candidatus Kaiserbacteria bacterium]|nr:hypothetical protein [Candidatus Kaiserbacteria bacterium]
MDTQKQKCQKCGSENIVMVEYGYGHPEHYDGVSETMCNDCKARFGRWSNKELKEGEWEPRGGRFKAK